MRTHTLHTGIRRVWLKEDTLLMTSIVFFKKNVLSFFLKKQTKRGKMFMNSIFVINNIKKYERKYYN
jgi:hypothetical protein